MRLAALTALVASLSAGFARADLPPLPDCQATMMVPAERRALGLAADDWHGYFVAAPAPGWAVYEFETYDGSQLKGISVRLEGCERGDVMTATVRFSQAAPDAFYRQVDEVRAAIVTRASADNATVYSLSDIAGAARAAGATVTTGRRQYQSCACSFLTGTLR